MNAFTKCTAGCLMVVASLSGLIALWSSCYKASLLRQQQQNFEATMQGHLIRLDRASAPGKTIFAGASTFQALDVSTIVPNSLNFSIGGERMDSLRARLATYHSLKRARAIVLNPGFNDLYQTCAVPSEQNVKNLLNVLPAEVPLFLLGVQSPPLRMQASGCATPLAALADKFNDTLQHVCTAHPRCTFIAHPSTIAGSEEKRLALFDEDGIHPSRIGYNALICKLRSALTGNEDNCR